MTPVPAARYLLRARDLVDAHYAEPLDVDDLAREAGVSGAHLSTQRLGAPRCAVRVG